jgi:hypothetical protein
MTITDQQAGLIALIVVAVSACFAPDGAKEILLTIAGGIVGWMSKGAA